MVGLAPVTSWTCFSDICSDQLSVICNWCSQVTGTVPIYYSWDWQSWAALKIVNRLSSLFWKCIPDGIISSVSIVDNKCFWGSFGFWRCWPHSNDGVLRCYDHVWILEDKSGMSFSVSLFSFGLNPPTSIINFFSSVSVELLVEISSKLRTTSSTTWSLDCSSC